MELTKNDAKYLAWVLKKYLEEVNEGLADGADDPEWLNNERISNLQEGGDLLERLRKAR